MQTRKVIRKSGLKDLGQPLVGYLTHHLNALGKKKQHGGREVERSMSGTLLHYLVKLGILCTSTVLQHFHLLGLQQELAP